MKIVYLDRATLAESVRLRDLGDQHQWVNYPTSNSQQAIERCEGADIVVTNKVNIDRALLEACPRIAHVAVSATGYNCVDIDACHEHSVSVSNIPRYASITVPEHVLTLALTLRRQLLQYRAKVIAGDWHNSDIFCLFDQPIRDLNGCVFGVLGFGDLGQATARLANAMGMRVIFTSRSDKPCDFARQVSLDELLRSCDVLSVHCSLNESSKNLIGAAQLAAMQEHCVLINTARGGVVDELATVEAIRKQQIGAIGFDVLCQEPPAEDSPLLQIAERNNVIITPHIAWASEHALQQVADILVDNVAAFIDGNATNLVN